MSTSLRSSAPSIAFIGGMDPSGGAGLAVDIPVARALQIHPLPIVSVQTSQNTTNVLDSSIAPLFQKQLESILNCNIQAIKIGLIAKEHIQIISSFIKRMNVPVVFDPIIFAGGGYTFHENPKLLHDLLLNSIVTPNLNEAQILTDYSPDPVNFLFNLGCKAVVLTDDVFKGDTHISLHKKGEKKILRYSYRKQENNFHGTGCLFTSSLISYLVKNEKIEEAVELALQYCQNAIKTGYSIDEGQLIPKI